MKLSFSLPPKPKIKSTTTLPPISHRNDTVDEGNFKEFVTVFDPSETLTSVTQKYIIPPLENRQIQNIDLPLPSASAIKFENEIPSGDGQVSITYGLRNGVESGYTRPESVQQLMLKSLKNDLRSLPDAPELEDFDSVPVKGFGEALLAGYGWKSGQGIGLRRAKDVQIVEYKKWNGAEGFGFNSSKGRNAKDVSFVGKEVRTGREIGSKYKNVDDLGFGTHKIENVEIYRKVSRTQAKASKKIDKDRTREKSSWLRSHIRVRIISKAVKGGRLYLKKAVVTDVVGPTTCDVTMDEKQELIQGIDQELLETALPRRGGPVLVLSGRHKGVYGTLAEKDLDKETGVVCDADSQEMLDVKLEQVAEYLGDPGDIGY